jgi:signal transduction histidine kinase
MKVLVVDDMTENLYLLDSIFQTRGYDVTVASNGKEALESARESIPDLIVSDVLMPVMDGFALCNICKNDDQLKHIPFVFYTATYTDPKDEEFALGLGADLFIVKPQEVHVFLRRIDEALDLNPDSRPDNTATANIDNNDFYRQYNVRLINKLEQKVEEITSKNIQLAARESELSDTNTRLEQLVSERTQALEDANRELEAFSYSVSHDLRSPLRSINGQCQLLKDEYAEKFDGNWLQHIDKIRAGTLDMEHLIDDMIALSLVQRHQLNREIVNISELAKKSIEQLQDTTPGRSVDVIIEPGMQVNGDKQLLGIALNNLLDNAWKYSQKSEHARIEISEKNLGNEVVYYVKDNGVGFSTSEADKLFQPFQRLHKQEEYEGSGIGLATVQRIIDRHHGKVWADAEKNAGATFYFTVPTPQQ